MIRHCETSKISRTSCFFILGGQLASSGDITLFSDSLKLQLYQHRGQLNLLKLEVYLKPPHLNIALWALIEVILAEVLVWDEKVGRIESQINWVCGPTCYVELLLYITKRRPATPGAKPWRIAQALLCIFSQVYASICHVILIRTPECNDPRLCFTN